MPQRAGVPKDGFRCVGHVLMAAVVMSLLSGCQTAPTQRTNAVLTESAVKRLFVGNTVESYNLNTSLTSFTYYHPNGEAIQERLWSRRLGAWSIEPDGKICLGFGKREPKCRHIIKDGDRYFKILMDEDGKSQKIVRYRYFAEGNALGRN